jgi:hypothetical protein
MVSLEEDYILKLVFAILPSNVKTEYFKQI